MGDAIRPRRRRPWPREGRLLACLLVWGLGCSPASDPEATPPPHRDILGSERKMYSQHDEELIIRDFFQDRRDGFFLDVGCAWAVHDSTTYYLEHHLGWSGIGVDALREYSGDWMRRPRSRFVSYLVSDHSGTEESFFRTDWPGLSSTDEARVADLDVGYTEIAVPTITLDGLLEEYQVTKVDFVSMDIEGAQLKALHGFDIEKYRPELVCIERHEPDREAIHGYFEEHGYGLVERYAPRDVFNWYYAPLD
jgi:FkbM family methyltransferase